MASTKTHKLQDGTDYYTINPKGYVPLLELDNGERLSEGPAIVQYIADQVPAKKLAPRERHASRATRLQEWLNFTTSEIHKGFSPLFNPATPEDYKTMVRTKLLDRYQVRRQPARGQGATCMGKRLQRRRRLSVHGHELGPARRPRHLAPSRTSVPS